MTVATALPTASPNEADERTSTLVALADAAQVRSRLVG